MSDRSSATRTPNDSSPQDPPSPDFANDTPIEAPPKQNDSMDGAPVLIRKPWQFAGWLTVYVASMTALITGMVKLDEPIAKLRGSETRWMTISVASIPLLATLFFHGLPTTLAHWRRKWIVRRKGTGDQSYFQLSPYREADRARFRRADLAHTSVLRWLTTTDEPVLYLTARSGCGKSSLLDAWVLPELRGIDPPFRVARVRTTFQPIDSLRAVLFSPDAGVFKRPTEETRALPAAALLTKAASEVKRDGKHLLIVFDQFEECLLEEADSLQRNELTSILRALTESPGIRVLLVVRSDYIGQLEQLALPPLQHDHNWFEVGAFDWDSAAKFLRGSDLGIGDALLERILHDGSEIDETPGLIRPIVLNMIGRVLYERSIARRGRTLPRREAIALVPTYIRDRVGASDAAHAVLKCMITSAGTKRPPQTSGQISASAAIAAAEVRGELLRLSRHGLVHRLDKDADTWEIAHDFVARMIDRHLLSRRRTLVQRLRIGALLAAFCLWSAAVYSAVPALYSERTLIIENIDHQLRLDTRTTNSPIDLGRVAGLMALRERAISAKYDEGTRAINIQLARAAAPKDRREWLPADAQRMTIVADPTSDIIWVGYPKRIEALSASTGKPVRTYDLRSFKVRPFAPTSVLVREAGRSERTQDRKAARLQGIHRDSRTFGILATVSYDHGEPEQEETLHLTLSAEFSESVGFSKKTESVDGIALDGGDYGTEADILVDSDEVEAQLSQLSEQDVAELSRDDIGRLRVSESAEDAPALLALDANNRGALIRRISRRREEPSDFDGSVRAQVRDYHVGIVVPGGSWNELRLVSYHPDARRFMATEYPEDFKGFGFTDVVPVFEPAAISMSAGVAWVRNRPQMLGAGISDEEPSNKMRVSSARWLADGQGLILKFEDGSVARYSADGRQLQHRFLQPPGARSVDVSPDGKQALVLCEDGRVDAWQLERFGSDGWAIPAHSNR